MSIKKYLSYSTVILALFVFAGTAAAQGNVINSASTTSTLTMTATVQTALNLEISTHGSGAEVTGTAGSGVYGLSFGNVNGLGLGAPLDANVTETAVTGGILYTTPIALTASYSGFAGEAASITVHQPAADGAAAVDMAREGASASILSGTLPASAATATPITGVTNGQVINRYVGVLVRNANAGATDEAGTRTMHLVYTISVP